MRKMIGVATFTLLLLIGTGGWATQILPMTAEELSKDAELVFVGTCLSREVKAGPPVGTEYTFKIETVVKGALQTGSVLTFRQWGALPGTTLPGGVSAPKLLGMPVYEVGRKLLLFLGPQSSRGFRSPVGLGQGVFALMQAEDGSTIIQNEMGNRFLFPTGVVGGVTKGKSLGTSAPPAGPLRLNDFLKTVRNAGGQP